MSAKCQKPTSHTQRAGCVPPAQKVGCAAGRTQFRMSWSLMSRSLEFIPARSCREIPMKNLFARSASACLLVLLSYGRRSAGRPVGAWGGRPRRKRLPGPLPHRSAPSRLQPACRSQHRRHSADLRRPHERDNSGQRSDAGHGGMGGSPAQVTCLAAAGTPVVLGLGLRAEGIDGQVLNDISLYCGIVAAQQRIPTQPAAKYHAPIQDDTYGALASGSEVERRKGQPMCPPGLIGVGVYGRSGAAVDWLGLICGAAQAGFVRTLNKRKRPPGRNCRADAQ